MERPKKTFANFAFPLLIHRYIVLRFAINLKLQNMNAKSKEHKRWVHVWAFIYLDKKKRQKRNESSIAIYKSCIHFFCVSFVF